MRTVYKYVVTAPHSTLDLPRSAKPLNVTWQDGRVCMWVELDDDAPPVKRTFEPVPTGGKVPDMGEYVGSVHGVEGWMVFHIYEVK